MNGTIRGALFAIVGFAVWSTHDAVIKLLGGSYTPFQIIFFSGLLGFPLATIMLMRDPETSPLRPVHPWWMAARIAAAAITGVCAFYAFSVLPLAQVYVFLFAAPFLITILSIPILGETVGPHRWCAVVVGLIGVIIALQPGATQISLGHVAGLTAAASSALASVITRRIGREERNAVMLLYPMTANVLIMGAVLPFVYEPMPIRDLGLLALTACSAFGASLAIIAAYRNADAAVVAPMQYSQILWAAVWGIVLFGEFPDRTTWLGVAVITAAGLYVVLRETIGGRSIHRPVTETRSRMATPTTPRISTLLMDRATRVEPGYVTLAKQKKAE